MVILRPKRVQFGTATHTHRQTAFVYKYEGFDSQADYEFGTLGRNFYGCSR